MEQITFEDTTKEMVDQLEHLFAKLAIAADAAAVEPAPPPENPADKEIAF